MSALPELQRAEAACSAGRYAEAEAGLRKALAAGVDDPHLLEMLSLVLRRQRRPQEALEVCEKLLARFPQRAGAWHEAGRTLNNLGQLDAARGRLQQAISLAPEDAGLQHDFGHVLQRLGETRAASEAFACALKLRPEWAVPRVRLALLDIDAGNFQAAREQLEAALGLDAQDADAWSALGVACHRLGCNEEAQAAYRQALAHNPRHGQALGNLGIVLHDAGEPEAAIAAYRHALSINPRDFRAAEHLADALLEMNDCRAALAAAEKLLKLFHGHSGALASKAIALQRLGRASEAADLLGMDELVWPIDIQVPAEFTDLDAFNSALAGHVLAHETLRYEPAGHATRHGQHTGDLLRYEKGPVQWLEQAVQKAVSDYQARLTRWPQHPLARSKPVHWRMSMWSVVMGSSGHQLPHIHPSAWLSGVYYARLPAEIRKDDADRAGWIEFGRPPESLAGGCDFPVRIEQPRAGRMYLFPAFLYHRTIPFSSEEPRISLAFDITPARASG